MSELKERMGEEREKRVGKEKKKTVLITNNNKTINNII